MHGIWGSTCLLPHCMTKCTQHKIFTVSSQQKCCRKHLSLYNIKNQSNACACLIFMCWNGTRIIWRIFLSQQGQWNSMYSQLCYYTCSVNAEWL
jgi:hypothetical protein